MINITSNLQTLIGKKNFNRFKLIAFLNFSTFVVELISLGSLPIFIASLINENETYNKLSLIFGKNFDLILGNSNLSFVLGIVVISSFLFKNLILMALILFQGSYFKKLKVELTNKIFDFYSQSNFLILNKRNPSLTVRNITNEIQNLLPYLTHFLNLIKELSAVLVIFLLLFYFEPISTLLVSSLFLLISLLYVYILKPLINKKSVQNQNFRNEFIKIVYETFGSIKDIKVMNKEFEVAKFFQKKLNKYENNLYIFFFLERAPRFILEILAVFIISALSIFYLSYSKDNISNLPSLSLFVVGAVRFLPAFSAITLSRYYLRLFNPSLNVLNEEFKLIGGFSYDKKFENKNERNTILVDDSFKIELKDVSFKYPGGKNYLLKNLNLNINFKDKIGITGPSGGGKSTLFDILLGLIEPKEGEVLLNKLNLNQNIKSYREKVGFVSQNLFIQDSTLKENIAFNFDNQKIDDKKINQAIEISGLNNLLKKSSKGINEKVGSNGLRLSGGERQRLALARAIYTEPEIFFLDEFTSSLDIEKEKEIFEKIFNNFKNKTFVIIAHRESALKYCNRRFILEEGQLREN